MGVAGVEGQAQEKYPWYEAVTDGTLEQGDLLPNFPLVVVTSSYEDLQANRARARIRRFDVIVLTQSCDLDAKKVENVIVCPHFEPSALATEFPELGSAKGQDRIRQGARPSLYMLPKCSVAKVSWDIKVVNFRQVAAVPFDLVRDHATANPERARYMSPYREHISQAFGFFVMRVGFPKDFKIA